jgi:hypothetical protein
MIQGVVPDATAASYQPVETCRSVIRPSSGTGSAARPSSNRSGCTWRPGPGRGCEAGPPQPLALAGLAVGSRSRPPGWLPFSFSFDHTDFSGLQAPCHRTGPAPTSWPGPALRICTGYGCRCWWRCCRSHCPWWSVYRFPAVVLLDLVVSWLPTPCSFPGVRGRPGRDPRPVAATATVAIGVAGGMVGSPARHQAARSTSSPPPSPTGERPGARAAYPAQLRSTLIVQAMVRPARSSSARTLGLGIHRPPLGRWPRPTAVPRPWLGLLGLSSWPSG